ncbi:7047_t:CDS:10, partial [Funneliformis caledonium]
EYYERTKKYTDAVVAYKSGSRYEEVIDLMQRHRKEIDEKIFHSVPDLGANEPKRHCTRRVSGVCEKNGQFRDEDVIEALQCILQLCREFEDIFVVSKVKDREQKRKCSFDNPFVHLIYEDTAETPLESQSEGRDIPFVSSYICKDAKSCQKTDCRKHDVVPSQSMQYQRLTLACLQYTVMRQWIYYTVAEFLKMSKQLREEWCIDKFDWEISKTIEISHPNDLPVGYDYYGYPKEIPVEKWLSSFFSWLHSNHYNCNKFNNSRILYLLYTDLPISDDHPSADTALNQEIHSNTNGRCAEIAELEKSSGSAETSIPAYKYVPQRTKKSIDPTFVVDSEEDEDDDRFSVSKDAS